MATANRRKMIFGIKCQMTPRIEWGPKISPKSLYLASFPRQMHFFFILRKNSRWPPKRAGNYFGQKVPDNCIDPGGQNYRQNHSTSHCFQDKCVFSFMQNLAEFYADGH